MELVIIGVLGGVALAAILWAALWKVVSRAVDNGLDWAIHTFGNDAAARRIEEKWKGQDR